MEDLVSVVAQTFVGMTLNCARCHAHKFDPLSHADYYRFKSALDGVRHGEGAIDTPAERNAREERIAGLNDERRVVERQLVELEAAAQNADQSGDNAAAVRQAGPRPVALWTFDEDARDTVGSLHGTLHGGATLADGRLRLDGKSGFLRTVPVTSEIKEKTLEAWVALAALDQGGGGVISIEDRQGGEFDAIVYGERQKRKWTSGSAAFARTRDLDAPEENFRPGELIHVAVVYAADNSIRVYRNGAAVRRSLHARQFAAALSRRRRGTFCWACGTRAAAGRFWRAKSSRRRCMTEPFRRRRSRLPTRPPG